MISEILRPVCAPRPPMKRMEITSAIPAGASVMRGASSERKMSRSNTMMKRNDRPWTWLPVLLDWAWLATLVAMGPATWNDNAGVGGVGVGFGRGVLKVVDDRLLGRDVALARRWS